MSTARPNPSDPRRVLVAYASRHGSTQEVAEAVADVLRERGFGTDVLAAAQVHDLAGYDAVVIGGALYAARWHRDARRLLARHREFLSTVPVAVFAMGPRTLDPDDVAQSRRELDVGLAQVPEVEPVSVAIFGGVVDPEKLHFPLSHMPAVDARDWDAIRAWAVQLADRFGSAHRTVPA